MTDCVRVIHAKLVAPAHGLGDALPIALLEHANSDTLLGLLYSS